MTVARSLLRRRHRIGGALLLIGVIAFLVLEQRAEAMLPGFDPAGDPLSRLGEASAPTRGLWTLALVALGVSWIGGVAVALGPGRSRWILALDLVPVLGIGTALLVPLDANLAVHEIAAFTAFLGALVAVVVNSERLPTPWRRVALGLVATAVLGLSPASGWLIARVGWGSLERMVVGPIVGAVLLFGLAATLGVGRRAGALTPTGLTPPGRRTLRLALVVVLLCLLGLGHGLTANGFSDVAAGLAGVPRAR